MGNIFHIASRYMSPEGTSLPIHIPFRVRNCGHYSIDESFRDNAVRKHLLQLYWGIRGTVRIRHQGTDYFLKPRSVFFYFPGDLHDVTAYSTPLEYCWFTIDGDYVADLIPQFELRHQIYSADSCPLELFEQLGRHLKEYTLHGEYLASSIAYQIMVMALSGPSEKSSLFDDFRELISRHYANPLLTIEDLAHQLKVHRSTLNRCLQAVSQLTPIEYLTIFRLNQAIQLLKSTRASIKEITQATGFSDASYFTKIFRQRYGMTPTYFRARGLVEQVTAHEGPWFQR